MAYATLKEFKDRLGKSTENADALIPAWLEAASDAIDNWTNRTFEVSSEASSHTYTSYSYQRKLWIHDLKNTSGLTVTQGSNTWTVDDLEVQDVKPGWPITYVRLTGGRYFTPSYYGDADITVTGLFGWNAIPALIKDATLMQTHRYFNRRTNIDAIATWEGGTGAIRLSGIDPDVAATISMYRRNYVS